MKTKVALFVMSVLAASPMWGQRATSRMTASISGSGGGDGKCTIEVVVDNAADVEINGRNAMIRTLSGAPASFRRFECNQEMPQRPANFRFTGVDGRGSQTLIASPTNGGPAVVRIQDPRSGSEGYTFDIEWSGGSYGRGGYGNGGYNNGGYGRDRDHDRDRGGWNNNNGWNGGDINFTGGHRAAGSFRETNNRLRRLDGATVFVGSNGNVSVGFDGQNGHVQFNGNVTQRNGNRITANVSGMGRSGVMYIETNGRNNVSRITMPNAFLDWSN
jgi:hypothetical protein